MDREINIAIANEFSQLADRFGIDVWEAIQIANRHPRVKILNPSPGVGGHCISVDPWFFVEAAPDITPLIHTARNVNDRQPEFVLALARRALGDLKGKRIALLGLAYKPDVDDLRESPAVELARLLKESGAVVSAFEPFKTDFKLGGVSVLSTLEETIRDVDALVLLVAHSQFRSLLPVNVAKLTSARIIVDAVNGFKFEEWKAMGFKVYRLGDRKNS